MAEQGRGRTEDDDGVRRDVWMPMPGPPTTAAQVRAMDALLDDLVAAPSGPIAIDYHLDVPKWQFLCHAATHGDLVLHGSGDTGIERFEPRLSNDVSAFGDRKAVYAATDGLWPMYFAILDRSVTTSLVNACIRLERPDGSRAGPYYFFSVDQPALEAHAWRPGTVYLLPSAGFELEGAVATTPGGATVLTAQAACLTEVVPIAKLAVTPADFPFLDRIRGHDPDQLRRRAAAHPDGFPWAD